MAEKNELMVHDMAQKIKDQIRTSIMAAVPEEKWEEGVKAEVRKFFEQKTIDGYNRQSVYYSDFSTLITAELKAITVEKFKEHIAKYPFSVEDENWDDMFKEVIKVSSAGILDNLGKVVAQNVLNIMRNQQPYQ